jgi:thymidylate synthase ThyX
MSDEIATHFNEEPLFADWIDDNIEHQKAYHYINSCNDSFFNYKALIDEFGMHRQDARGVLPLDTATRCVYTYSTKEWFEIIKKRVYNTTGKAHPNATIICKLIEQELNGLGYEVEI